MLHHPETIQPRSGVGAIPRSDSPLEFPARDQRALGTNAGFASAAELSQKFRYYLQSLACKLLPDEKITSCHKFKVPNETYIRVLFDPTNESVTVKNLITCDRRNICAVCAAKLTERDRNELLLAISHSGFRAVMFTYTLSHHQGESLKTVLGKLKDSYKFLKAGRRFEDLKKDYGMIGSIRSREVTVGQNGWHPHIHEIVLLNASTTDDDLARLEDKIKSLWDNAVNKFQGSASWEHGVDMKIGDDELHEYVAKNGHEPIECKWTLEHELVKSSAKHGRAGSRNMWQVLADYGDGDEKSGDLFQEYAANFKGDHPLRWSDGLKETIGIIGGEEVEREFAELAEESMIELAELNDHQWSVIVETDNRAELRKQARSGDRALFQEWLRVIGVPQYIHIDLNEWLDRPPKRKEYD